MIRILGIDPGSRKTGFGVIDVAGSKMTYVTSGIVRLKEGDLPSRLGIISQEIASIIQEFRPAEFAIEDVFFARDPRAALKLGQARGAAIVAAVNLGLDVSEYSARAVKKAVVGTGAADKEQVQHMVGRLLNLKGKIAEDAADALAVAICHGQSVRFQKATDSRLRYSRGRLKSIK